MHVQQFLLSLKRVGQVYTPFSQFNTVASNSEENASDCEIGKIAKALVNRSNMTMAVVFAILAYFTQASTPDQTSIMINTFITLLVLCLCLLNRACFNDLPLDVFQVCSLKSSFTFDSCLNVTRNKSTFSSLS
ncbi:hypothetical protein DL96DRAFT_1584184 [Flagelloscypha sp. PMI_526]|nr:hypothetical protein DL96DRAFT_1584184 [Flagelloscypha sp. PMI_526]